MFDVWENLDGISMRCFGEKLRVEASSKPLTISVAPNHLLADPEAVIWLDLREITLEDFSNIKMTHVAVANKKGRYQGICLWFTCSFPSFTTESVTLSTSPEDQETHWKQTTIVLPAQIEIEEKAPMAFELSLTRSTENIRRYNIEVAMLDPEEVEHQEYCGCYMTKCILVRAMLEKYEKDSLSQ